VSGIHSHPQVQNGPDECGVLSISSWDQIAGVLKESRSVRRHTARVSGALLVAAGSWMLLA